MKGPLQTSPHSLKACSHTIFLLKLSLSIHNAIPCTDASQFLHILEGPTRMFISLLSLVLLTPPVGSCLLSIRAQYSKPFGLHIPVKCDLERVFDKLQHQFMI